MTTMTSEPYDGGELAQSARPEVDSDFEVSVQPVRLGNSEVLSNLSSKLSHLTLVAFDELSSFDSGIFGPVSRRPRPRNGYVPRH